MPLSCCIASQLQAAIISAALHLLEIIVVKAGAQRNAKRVKGYRMSESV